MKPKYELMSKGQYIKHRLADSKKELYAKIIEWIDFAEICDELTIKVL